jgi:hypothetical protein
MLYGVGVKVTGVDWVTVIFPHVPVGVGQLQFETAVIQMLSISTYDLTVPEEFIGEKAILVYDKPGVQFVNVKVVQLVELIVDVVPIKVEGTPLPLPTKTLICALGDVAS